MTEYTNDNCLRKADEWRSFADFLGNMIAKYTEVLNIDSLPDPDIFDEESQIKTEDIEKHGNE